MLINILETRKFKRKWEFLTVKLSKPSRKKIKKNRRYISHKHQRKQSFVLCQVVQTTVFSVLHKKEKFYLKWNWAPRRKQSRGQLKFLTIFDNVWLLLKGILAACNSRKHTQWPTNPPSVPCFLINTYFITADDHINSKKSLMGCSEALLLPLNMKNLRNGIGPSWFPHEPSPTVQSLSRLETWITSVSLQPYTEIQDSELALMCWLSVTWTMKIKKFIYILNILKIFKEAKYNFKIYLEVISMFSFLQS